MFVYLKFRFQRTLRRLRRDFFGWRRVASAYLARNVWGKWKQLGIIRRFISLWLGIVIVVTVGLWQQTRGLSQYYQIGGPARGGVYSEGLVGTIKSINPLLPDNSQSDDVSSLIFNGLTRNTPNRGIEGDLAESWETSADGKVYTFHLRSGVKWHDNTPFTAQDVLFTMQLLQDPDVRSPLASSWQGVKVEASNESTVVFTLPNPYPPFIYSTTVGILPVHVLGGEDPSKLRISTFNQNPIGTGPFKLISFNPVAGLVELKANADYMYGKPVLEGFNVRFYPSDAEVASAYAKKQVTAIGRLRGDELTASRQLGSVRLTDLSLPDETDLFMRTAAAPLNDKAVRQALSQAISRSDLLTKVEAGRATPLDLPLLPGQLGYTTKYTTPAHDPTAAGQLLDKAGWVRTGDARSKDGQTLRLRLVTLASGDYPAVADELKAELAVIGVQLDVIKADITQLQQSYIRPRNYDLLLYAVNVGADPDVYVYWHSSQASDPGLNLSQYSSKDADKALESARIAQDPAIRAARYGNFLAAWTADLPAMVLYNPSYVYAVNPSVQGQTAHKLVYPSDRFYGVEKWSVNTKPRNKLVR